MIATNEVTRVLVVDDDDRLRNTSQNLLLRAGFETEVAVDGLEGIKLLQASDYDVVLLDFQMPELDGIQTLKRIKEFRPEVIVIMMTAYASRDNADEAIALNAYDYVSKPFDLNRVVQLISDAKEAKAAIAEVSINGPILWKEGAAQVFDTEDPERNNFFLVNEVNRGDPPAVIVGEYGTGRTRLAEVLHVNSVRKTRKLITVACRGVATKDLEARLFGTEGGPAGGRREIGALERSSGGTLLVQDLHEVEPDLAHRLLEAARTGHFTRADSDRVHTINTRLILILPAEAAGEFEGDGPLGRWAKAAGPRLLTLPPLRERRDELPGILTALLRRHAEAQGKDVAGFSEDALERLIGYDWPGNLREADNILDNAVMRERGQLVTTASLPAQLMEAAEKPSATEATYQEALASFERTYFQQLMDEHGGDLEQVARQSHLTVEELKKKLRQLKVEVPE